jgi:hypothetical protein
MPAASRPAGAVVFPSDLPITPTPLDGHPAPDLALVDELLRDRPSLLDRIDRGADLTRLARAMIVTIAFCGAAFGAAAGMRRGGPQVPLSAIKLPLALLLTAAICAPVLTSLKTVLFGRANLRKDLAIVLCSLGLASLVAAALSPLVLLAANSPTLDYYRMVLVVVACAAIGGLVGVGFFLQTLHSLPSEERGFLGLTVLVVFALVGSQTVWTFRPYLGRHGKPVVVMYPVQGSFLDSVVRTAWSAAGRVPSERVEVERTVPVPVPVPALAPSVEPAAASVSESGSVPGSVSEPAPEPEPVSEPLSEPAPATPRRSRPRR